MSVRDLVVRFETPQGEVHAVNGVSLDVGAGETVGLVGESGSGKSVTSLAVMGLLPAPAGRVASGQILFDGTDLIGLPERELRKLRGKDVSMVFQDPMSSLNPVITVGEQVTFSLDRRFIYAFDPATGIALIDRFGFATRNGRRKAD